MTSKLTYVIFSYLLRSFMLPMPIRNATSCTQCVFQNHVHCQYNKNGAGANHYGRSNICIIRTPDYFPGLICCCFLNISTHNTIPRKSTFNNRWWALQVLEHNNEGLHLPYCLQKEKYNSIPSHQPRSRSMPSQERFLR